MDILTCGVCHTDLHYKQGGISDDFPFLLGHEATGVVSAVGPDVTEVAPGDRVILNWRAVCGQCRSCAKGEPQYCFNTHNATQKMTLEDGTELSPALGIGAFAEKTLVAAGQCTKVDDSVDPAAVGLLGCGVMAGIGAAINTGEIKRGESVAVIGCGGVGIAAVAGAKLAGATTIIAVDIDPNKVEMAKSLGATHGVNSSVDNPVVAVRYRGQRRRRGDLHTEVGDGPGAGLEGQVVLVPPLPWGALVRAQPWCSTAVEAHVGEEELVPVLIRAGQVQTVSGHLEHSGLLQTQPAGPPLSDTGAARPQNSQVPSGLWERHQRHGQHVQL